MFTVNKDKNKDFTVLNIADPQIDYELWDGRATSFDTVRFTLGKIIPKVKPDMITMTGDFADEFGRELYDTIITYIDSFGIPWAPVMGNHDHEDGCDPYIVAEMLSETEHCLFEAGDPALGCGHYTVAVEEDGRLVTAFIMMDSHHRKYITDENGKEVRVNVPYSDGQYRWYESQVDALRSIGCEDSTLVVHFPLYEYKYAWEAARRPRDGTSGPSETASRWNAGYEDSLGTNYEPVEPLVEKSPMFEIAKRLGHTKNILCAHDHGNASSIVYEGIRLTYGLKTGSGGYFAGQNGAAVITVGEKGVKSVRYEYVSLDGI
ncbi:MAG: metallophosphoesterase [Clostridia bacterium]|nr:metallophosphoesterase [Clostridia bacterium]